MPTAPQSSDICKAISVDELKGKTMTVYARNLQSIPNKALRILIADQHHFHSMQIERILNRYGYFRIAPMHSLKELLNLVEYACEAFDLLIINASLATAQHFDLLAFCRNNSKLKHTLIYAENSTEQASIPEGIPQHIQLCPLQLPEAEMIRNVLTLIAPSARAS